MNSIQGWIRWASTATFLSAAIMAAGVTFVSAPAQAAYEFDRPTPSRSDHA